MALSNAEKQARWRERHLAKRRSAQRIAGLLLRKGKTDAQIEQIAVLLSEFFNREGIRALRRALRQIKEPTDEESAAHWREQAKQWRALWLREHPGRTRAEYDRLTRDHESEVWEWRRAKGRAINEAERLAWEADHPGQEFPEHECALSDRESSDLALWRRQRARRQARQLQRNRGDGAGKQA